MKLKIFLLSVILIPIISSNSQDTAVDVVKNNTTDSKKTLIVDHLQMIHTSKSASYQLTRKLISPLVVDGSSISYEVIASGGEPIVGGGSSASYNLAKGFWSDFVLPGCCINSRGNANGDPGDLANIADITFLVSYLFGIPSGPAPVCIEEANANSDPGELANIADITFLVNFLFGIPSGPAPGLCP